jgi:predicted HTH transcriptional regulator
MEKVILKTIAALSNGKGGTLLIGVDDKKNILGLENDYQVLRKPDNDGFQLHLEQLVDTAFGTDFTASNILVSFPKIDEKFICEVVVSRGTEPLYVEETDKHGKKEKKFYLRSGNSSKAQDVEAAAKYISQRFTS